MKSKEQDSRFGTRDDYTVSVRCIEEKGLVLFLAAGRDRVKANALQLNLQRNYLKGTAKGAWGRESLALR